MHSPIDLPASGSHQSMADLLSSKESGLSLPIAGPHLSAEKSSSKLSGYGLNVKRPSFWGRNNVSWCTFFMASLF